MQVAIRYLDEAGAPGDIAAHVDLAICRLENFCQKPPVARVLNWEHLGLQAAEVFLHGGGTPPRQIDEDTASVEPIGGPRNQA